MSKLIKWVSTQGTWNGSELSLPSLDPSADAALQRWCVVAGGLALILSRVSEAGRSSRFASSHELYALIRRRLRQSQPLAAGAELLGEVMHEIAEVADPLTRSCLKDCFQESLDRRAPATAAVSLAAGQAVSAFREPNAARSSAAPGAANASAYSSTSVMPDLLIERSVALRRKLAQARTPVSAELN